MSLEKSAADGRLDRRRETAAGSAPLFVRRNPLGPARAPTRARGGSRAPRAGGRHRRLRRTERTVCRSRRTRRPWEPSGTSSPRAAHRGLSRCALSEFREPVPSLAEEGFDLSRVPRRGAIRTPDRAASHHRPGHPSTKRSVAAEATAIAVTNLIRDIRAVTPGTSSSASRSAIVASPTGSRLLSGQFRIGLGEIRQFKPRRMHGMEAHGHRNRPAAAPASRVFVVAAALSLLRHYGLACRRAANTAARRSSRRRSSSCHRTTGFEEESPRL